MFVDARYRMSDERALEPSAVAVPFDTSADAQAKQGDVYRRMGGRERLDISFRLTDTVRRMSMRGIRARHPEYDDEHVCRAYVRLVLGDVLVRAAWPDRELVDP
jgi:hypothetical protein